jgi:hypothetical protein
MLTVPFCVRLIEIALPETPDPTNIAPDKDKAPSLEPIESCAVLLPAGSSKDHLATMLAWVVWVETAANKMLKDNTVTDLRRVNTECITSLLF